MNGRCSVCGCTYTIRQFLGKGKSGYSYLASDPRNVPVVLKQIHHEPCDYYSFGDKLAAEIHAYRHLCRIGIRMPELLGADRKKEVIIKTYIPGRTIFELIRDGNFPEAAWPQITEMCSRLYAADTNIDYFPTNFVWYNNQLYYVDYEFNAYSEKWDFEHWGRTYWTRSPEFLEYVNAAQKTV